MALNQSWVWVLTYPFLNIILVVISGFGEGALILQHLYLIPVVLLILSRFMLLFQILKYLCITMSAERGNDKYLIPVVVLTYP
jgi:uncharacterized membrane protein